MPERSHLSIGEVLSLLREEFPDVTISKIRFLESQGLVDPERTPSGYRKFYDHDVERLRWILRQQRENFLPLKVIRGRLSEQGDLADDGTEGDDANGLPEESEAGRLFVDPSRVRPARPAEAVSVPAPLEEAAGAGAGGRASPSLSSHPAAAARRASVRTAERPERLERLEAARAEPAARGPAVSSSPVLPVPPVSPAASGGSAGPTSSAGQEDSDSYTAEELAASSGATVLMVRELEQFGLISPHAVVAGTPYFDGTALTVTKAAAGFAGHGVEARHLRSWRNAADREAGLFEQVVMPLLRQRNPEARRRAAATLAEMSRLGADLHQALVDQAVRRIR